MYRAAVVAHRNDPRISVSEAAAPEPRRASWLRTSAAGVNIRDQRCENHRNGSSAAANTPGLSAGEKTVCAMSETGGDGDRRHRAGEGRSWKAVILNGEAAAKDGSGRAANTYTEAADNCAFDRAWAMKQRPGAAFGRRRGLSRWMWAITGSS
jgi:hypothetical protein